MKAQFVINSVRKFMFCATAVAMLLGVSVSESKADPAAEARAALTSAIDEVLDLIKDPAFTNPATREAQIDKIDDSVRKIFDFSEFSARTVGRNWKDFSETQKNAFIEAFAQLLRATYIDKIEGYDGEKVLYLGETVGTKGDKVEVNTEISVKNQEAPIKVSYRLLNKGHWVVYDVIIEGVSLVQNYRTQFNDLLQKGDADALIARVNSRAQELHQQNRNPEN